MFRAALAAALALAATAAMAQDAPAPATPPAAGAAEAMPDPFDCTLTAAFLCEAGKGCSPAKTMGTLPLPSHLLLHFSKQIVASTNAEGVPHISSVSALSTAGDNITLQGADGLAGWIIQTSRSNPGVTFTVVDHDSVLTAFGSCKPAE